jgi:hypothetical protein
MPLKQMQIEDNHVDFSPTMRKVMEQFPKNEQARTNSTNFCCEKCLALPQRVSKKSSYIDHGRIPIGYVPTASRGVT